MTSILCALALWQPATTPPVVTKDVRGVAITLPDSGRDWFEVTLKREGEDWEDVLPERPDRPDCAKSFFAGLPWSGLDFEVVFSRNSRAPHIEVPDADELIIPEGAGILDAVLLNNFGLHQTF